MRCSSKRSELLYTEASSGVFMFPDRTPKRNSVSEVAMGRLWVHSVPLGCASALDSACILLRGRSASNQLPLTLLVAAWFRSRPGELQRALSPDAAKERLRTKR